MQEVEMLLPDTWAVARQARPNLDRLVAASATTLAPVPNQVICIELVVVRGSLAAVFHRQSRN